MNVKGLGRYAKFITAIAGDAIVYLQFYGTTWHLVPAVTMLGAALGVFGVPNAGKPAAEVGWAGPRIPPAQGGQMAVTDAGLPSRPAPPPALPGVSTTGPVPPKATP